MAAILCLSVVRDANAGLALFTYSSVISLCTGTCASFAALDVGSTISGTLVIDLESDGSFSDANVSSFALEVFNPAVPTNGPVGDPATDNPMLINSELGTAVSNGTMGTVDAADPNLLGGQLLLELLVPPLSPNGAYVVIDLAAEGGQICLFYPVAGCIPGATQAVRFEGGFDVFPSEFVLSPRAINFGTVALGEPVEQELAVSMTGCFGLCGSIELGQISGLEPPFSIIEDSCSLQTIDESGGCSVTVSYLPTSPGVFSDMFEIPSNAHVNPLGQLLMSGGESYAYNIDVGSGRGTPAAGALGAAAGQFGHWNSIGLGNTTLSDLNGNPTVANARILAAGEGSYAVGSEEATKLLADHAQTECNVTERWSLGLDGIANGVYEVFVYAPSDPLVSTGTIVVNELELDSLPGDPNSNLVEGVSWRSETLTVSDGTINLRRKFNSTGCAGVAGVQIVKAPEPKGISMLIFGVLSLALWRRRHLEPSAERFDSIGRFI